MKRKYTVRVYTIILLAIVGVSSINAQEKTKIPKGFKVLFNGEDLDNWDLKIRNGDAELAKKLYAIEDGMVHVFNDEFPEEYELNTGENATHGLFYTKRKYSKYIFRFEYKWGTKIANNFGKYQYDAGMYYHVVDNKIWPIGIEYQVRYNHKENQNHTGDYWAKELKWYSKDGKTFLAPSEGGLPVLGHKGEHRASPDAKFNALNGEWNTCEVIVMGDKYSIHKLNGKIVNMATDLPFSEGVIGLQSETAEIYYRNIMIKELKKSIPLKKFLKKLKH